MKKLIFVCLLFLSFGLAASDTTVCKQINSDDGDGDKYKVTTVLANEQQPECPLVINTKRGWFKDCSDCYLNLYQYTKGRFPCRYKNSLLELKCKKDD
jgi:hypothetical protein